MTHANMGHFSSLQGTSLHMQALPDSLDMASSLIKYTDFSRVELDVPHIV